MKPTVMMVHGMCCTGEVWSGFRQFFESRGARVVTPTLLPEVRTSVLQKPNRALKQVSFNHYIDELLGEAARIEQETGQKPVVIGHSMGGLLAQVLAERGAVQAAVLISPTAPGGVATPLHRLVRAFIKLVTKVGVMPSVITPDRHGAARMVFNAMPKTTHRAAYEAFVHESGRAFSEFLDWHVDHAKIEVPLLTVSARRDRLVPAVLVRLTGKRYEAIGGELREYDAHAHWLYAEPGWETPASEIYDWLLAKTSTVSRSGSVALQQSA
jgi:pimeloyl-ACP methyl ester carboxylesterase